MKTELATGTAAGVATATALGGNIGVAGAFGAAAIPVAVPVAAAAVGTACVVNTVRKLDCSPLPPTRGYRLKYFNMRYRLGKAEAKAWWYRYFPNHKHPTRKKYPKLFAEASQDGWQLHTSSASRNA